MSRKRSNPVKWIACSSTTEVNRAIKRYVRDGDAVAELGSQLRASSTTLCEAIGPTGKAVLVDVERKFPNAPKGNGNKAGRDMGGKDRTSAMRREGDDKNFYSDRATFVETKGFENWRDALFFRESSPLGSGRPRYDALVLDMSTLAGNDLELTCISLVREFVALNDGSNVFGEEEDEPQYCRVVIVKSRSLHSLARRLHHAQHIVSGARQLPEGRGGDGGRASIIGAVGVKQYRDTINFVVWKGDVCLEVGCHLGTTTALIDEAAKERNGQTDNGAKVGLGGCLGVDIGASIVASAKKKYPNLSFEVGDGFKTGALARMKEKHFCIFKSNGNNNKSSLCSSATYDVVYVDIGGLSGSEGLLEAVSLLASLDHALEPRCIVIKSLCVRRLASCLVPFSEVWQKEILCK